MASFKKLLAMTSLTGLLIGAAIGALTDDRRPAAAAGPPTIVGPANMSDDHGGSLFGGGSRFGGRGGGFGAH